MSRVNLPISIKLYAGLAFLCGIATLCSAVWLAVLGVGFGSVVFDAVWAACQILLGVGILRLRPAARVIALVFCWFTFVLFVFVLVCWCIWPHSTSVGVFVYVATLAAINLYFYVVFRSPEIRAMFHLTSSRSL
jgi:hypothetical protein